MSRSGLIIEVPAAEPSVGPWRELIDPQAALGVPAHITVLFPFVGAAEIDEHVIARASRVAGRHPAFDLRLTAVRWFGDTVVWLAPEPAERLSELTRAFMDAFPGHPPYGGIYDDVVPHLTVGDGGTLSERVSAADALAPILPLRTRADAVTLLVERPGGRWMRQHRFPLG